MKRKLLSILLTLCLAFSLLPTAALAEGETGTLQSQIATSGTVTLDKDYTEDITIPSGADVTLDLNGKTLSNTNNSKATLSVEGTAVVKNGTISGGTGYYNIEVKKGGSLTLENVTATAGNTGSSMIDNWGTLTITSGDYSGGLNVVKSEEGSILNISGGKFTLSYATNGYTGVILAYGTTTITGGEFIQSLTTTGRWNHPQVVVTGVVEGYPAITKITGGTFTNNMSGEGIFRGLGKATFDNFEVSGGTYNKSVSDGFFKDGYFAKKVGSVYTADGPYAAKIGSTGYNTLAAAVEAVANNGTITLLQDISSDRINLETKSFTVSLNGHTLTSTAAYGVMFCAKNGNTITVKGDKYSKLVGTLMVTSGTDGHIAISGGTYENPKYCPIYINGAVNSENSTLTVKNATITASGTDSDQDAGCAVYLAGYCKSTFTGTTITAPVTGIEIRAGKLTLKNCTVTGGNGTVTTSANGNGTTVKNAALAISQHTTKKPIDVTVTGGEYTATAAIYQTDVQSTGSAGVNATVNSGKFNGTVSAETNNTVAVKGGTFTNAVPENCCADGYVPQDNGNGTFGVQEYKPIEVWTGYSGSTGSKVESYTNLADAAKNLGNYQWILVANNYTLNENFAIPKDVRLDIKGGATLTVAEGATLTVAADANRLAVLTGGSIVNNGTIMVLGKSYASGSVMVQDNANIDLEKLTVPNGYFLGKNGNKYYAAKALFEVTFTDGSTKQLGELADLAGATKVTLLANVTDFNGYIFTKLDGLAENFVLDLGGYTLSGKNTAAADVLSTSVPMTITNGTVKFTGPATENAGALRTSADVTIASDAIIDGGAGYAIWTYGYGHTLTVNGKVQSNGAYAITGNGSDESSTGTKIDVANCNITVNAGAVISAPNGVAIYHPEKGTVTINGGEIKGHTGIEMCAGKLVVKDGTITSTGANKDETGSQNAILDGAAISIINRNYPGGVPTAEITGGTIKATGTGMTVKAYDYKSDTVASWTDVSNYVDISGGTFSSIPDNMNALCAAGYIPFKNADGTYGVTRPSSGSSGSYDPTYSVSTPSKTEHGSVTVSPKSASKGDTVTVTVKPDSGYVLETLTVTDKNGNELTLKDKGNGKYTFTMPAGKVEVKATFMEDNSMLNFFYDVPNNAYFYEAVKWAVKNGITDGVGNNLFAPEQPCTRAQIVTFLWRAAGSPEPKGAASGMTDVVSGSYYEKAVAWAIENGITTGTTATTFSPDATCTRAQAVTFLARALKAKAASAAEFSDVPTDSYFADAVAWAAANGVTEGIGGGLFGSDNDCTRGQIVTFLYRAYNK